MGGERASVLVAVCLEKVVLGGTISQFRVILEWGDLDRRARLPSTDKTRPSYGDGVNTRVIIDLWSGDGNTPFRMLACMYVCWCEGAWESNSHVKLGNELRQVAEGKEASI